MLKSTENISFSIFTSKKKKKKMFRVLTRSGANVAGSPPENIAVHSLSEWLADPTKVVSGEAEVEIAFEEPTHIENIEICQFLFFLPLPPPQKKAHKTKHQVTLEVLLLKFSLEIQIQKASQSNTPLSLFFLFFFFFSDSFTGFASNHNTRDTCRV